MQESNQNPTLTQSKQLEYIANRSIHKLIEDKSQELSESGHYELVQEVINEIEEGYYYSKLVKLGVETKQDYPPIETKLEALKHLTDTILSITKPISIRELKQNSTNNKNSGIIATKGNNYISTCNMYNNVSIEALNSPLINDDTRIEYITNISELQKRLRQTNIHDGLINKNNLIITPTHGRMYGDKMYRTEGWEMSNRILKMYKDTPGMYLAGKVLVLTQQTTHYNGNLLEDPNITTVLDDHNEYSNPQPITRTNNGLPNIELMNGGWADDGYEYKMENYENIINVGSQSPGSPTQGLVQNERGQVINLENEVVLMNAINPSERISIDSLIENQGDLENKNALLIKMKILPVYNALGEAMKRLDGVHIRHSLTEQNTRTNEIEMILDVHDLEGKIMQLLKELKQWESRNGEVIIKGAYNLPKNRNWN